MSLERCTDTLRARCEVLEKKKELYTLSVRIKISKQVITNTEEPARAREPFSQAATLQR